MIKVTKEVIEQCAKTLMFDLSEGQADVIYEEFDTVLAQIEFLGNIKGVDESEPMTFPYKDHQSLMREDRPSKTLASDEALSNSNTKLGNQIKLPKVVGNKNEHADE